MRKNNFLLNLSTFFENRKKFLKKGKEHTIYNKFCAVKNFHFINQFRKCDDL